ncbi:ISAs1 family transposase [Actinokineospora sp. NBRC 105648]|uniref:ISAs1 family transposase n=1 Tax=Actinokineospora sp. NBRC 105648 TaxID=3032206 RepID=UPI00331B9CEE
MSGLIVDRRSPRGKVYGLVFVLAASLVAVLAGARNFRSIADQVADFPPSLLSRLGGVWCRFSGVFRVPSRHTVRRVLSDIDGDAFDLAVGSWLLERVRRDSDGLLRIAIDGQVFRGAWTDENDQFTLFSAMVHREGVTIAQVQVPADTNEITQVKALLAGVLARDAERVVVTMDAAHTQRDTAEHLVGERGLDYVATCKGNQPSLLRSVFTKVVPLTKGPPHHVVKERGHGRLSHWSTWVTDAEGIDFPHVRQIACIRWDIFNMDGQRVSKECAWIVTSIAPERAQAADLHAYTREHWGIENKSHYVRGVTWVRRRAPSTHRKRATSHGDTQKSRRRPAATQRSSRHQTNHRSNRPRSHQSTTTTCHLERELITQSDLDLSCSDHPAIPTTGSTGAAHTKHDHAGSTNVPDSPATSRSPRSASKWLLPYYARPSPHKALSRTPPEVLESSRTVTPR